MRVGYNERVALPTNRVPLARARGGASQEGLVSLLGAERRKTLLNLFLGWALREGKARRDSLSLV
jgi:hypothetical protein